MARQLEQQEKDKQKCRSHRTNSKQNEEKRCGVIGTVVQGQGQIEIY